MTRADILAEAKRCVCGQRQQDYGNPEDNFQVIADLWNAYIGRGTLFMPKDVAMMMSLLKVARIRTGTGTADCYIDLAGYAACAGEIATRNKPIPASMAKTMIQKKLDRMEDECE